jgi:outer membrane protein
LRQTSKRNKTGILLLTTLLLGTVSGPLVAQNAGGGAAGGNGAGNGAGEGATGVGGNNAGNNGTGNSTGNGNAGATGVSGTNGQVGQNGNGTGGTNPGTSSAGTGTNASLSNGATPGNSLLTTVNPAPQTYDLARTITDAIKASSDVQTATRNVQIDKKQADAEAAQGRPQINAQGTATRYDSVTKVAFAAGAPGTPAQSITVLPNATQVLSLNLGEQFDIAGQIHAATEEYSLESQADKDVLLQATHARILRAKSVYFDLLQTYHQEQVAVANLTDAQENLTIAQQQNAAGTGLKLDLLRAQTLVSQDEQQEQQAQNNYGVAESTFNDLVGRPLATPITLQDVPGVTVGTTISDTGSVGAPTEQTLFPAPDLSKLDLNQSLQTAYMNRPEILGDRVNVQVAGINVKLARAGVEPTLEGNINGFYYPTTDFQTPRKRVAQASITLTIPIYDGNRAHDLIQEAHLRQANAQTTLDSQISDVTLDVRQSYLNLVTAAAQIASANAALQSAIAALQNAEIRYRGGVGLFLEVTDAQAALVQSQNSQINAVYNYLVAQAQFQNAIGVPQTQ